MLKNTLSKISEPKTPFEQLFKRKEPLKYSKGEKPLKKVFADNDQKILFERLTASLREVAIGIKEQMEGKLEEVASKLVQDAFSKIRIPLDGKNADENKIISIILSKIPKPKNGINGKDAIIDEKKIIAELIKLIPPARVSRNNGGGGDTIIADDLSTQCDGSTRTFTTTHRIGKPILAVSSQFPNVLRLTTDFTATGMSFVIDSAIPYIASGQTLYFIYAEG